MKLKCDNCSREGEEEGFTDANDLWQRLEIGGIYTDKECPDCGALAFPIAKKKTNPPLRKFIVGILKARGESLLNDRGVDGRVAGKIADAIIQHLPVPAPEPEPSAFGFNVNDIQQQANSLGLKLTRGEAKLVISTLLSKGDASIGVNWGTIGHYILHCKVGTKLTAAEKRLHEAYQIIKAK